MARTDIMNGEERRLILDRGFDRTVDTVLDAFLQEGFRMNPVGAGDLRRPETSPRTRRYAMLDAVLPELTFREAASSEPPAVLGCRISIFELTTACTLVTIERPVVRYPMLAALVPRVTERVGHVVSILLQRGTLTAA
jgi:hypothetical protein